MYTTSNSSWYSSCYEMGALGFHSATPVLRGAALGHCAKRLVLSSRNFAMADAAQQAVSSDHAEANIWQVVSDHQRKAVKLSHADEARTLLANKEIGFLSTISQKYEGFPVPSTIEFASDSNGQPLLAVSSLSPHTKNMECNPKCSLLVARDPLDKSDTSITVVGEASYVSGEDWKEAREVYLKKYPRAFWVDFGDFKIAKIKPKTVRFVSGLKTGHAEVEDLSSDNFQSAKVDPISQFSTPISSHMNKDHSADTQAIVEHVVGVKVDHAFMLDVDSLGFYVKAAIQGTPTKLRIPFPRAAQDRKDVKTLIVEMLSAARATTTV
ncbi:glutamyl-tRNA reductase-binding protein, chloroplastic isoform X2 [Selaginella moellendorffii]|uniref:glutamyl-tRNA reductase-binding protein, chloroplastic isoform X2 n=1 Tax=Selaginella moellendorffii TaxID=88036 RepID=UPI000D1C4D60|nr:glutamyl-tRNA reductase-binding protein, chloroplastic isoform X2 [Selaginella moellendorffii]|eukprot:XP_024522527.1 glutamyl-tRNA reductase-binding protein, chloroplastic isoform X2 [Selaginella moellendorffii]